MRRRAVSLDPALVVSYNPESWNMGGDAAESCQTCVPVALAPTAPAPGNATADANANANGTIVLELGEVSVRMFRRELARRAQESGAN